MPSSDAFALGRSGLNEFLFAAVGTEANGMTLSLISVFARLGTDPWLEAGRLARLPKSEATETLARIIAGMPTSVWPLYAATTIAARLIALLPTQSGELRLSLPAAAFSAKARRSLMIGLILVSATCALAFGAGVFTPTPKSDGSGAASLATPLR